MGIFSPLVRMYERYCYRKNEKAYEKQLHKDRLEYHAVGEVKSTIRWNNLPEGTKTIMIWILLENGYGDRKYEYYLTGFRPGSGYNIDITDPTADSMFPKAVLPWIKGLKSYSDVPLPPNSIHQKSTARPNSPEPPKLKSDLKIDTDKKAASDKWSQIQKAFKDKKKGEENGGSESE